MVLAGRRVRSLLSAAVVAAALVAAPGAQWGALGAPTGRGIIGGEAAASGTWPAAVALGRPGQAPLHGAFCGGTLIHPQWVATAAHCVQYTPPRLVVVHTGSTWLRSAQMRTVAVERIVRAHWRPTVDRNDLALLQLDTPQAADAMALAQARDYRPRRWATILGWGSVRENGRGKSARLQQGRLRLIGSDSCRRLWRTINPRRQVCAGLTTFRAVVDSCYGDSGGPLVIAGRDGSPRLAGIASYGTRQCGAPRRPGVYTTVAPFADWIGRTIDRYTPEPPEPLPPEPAPDSR